MVLYSLHFSSAGWIFQEATEEENGEMKNKKQHKTEKEFFSSGLPQKCDCTIKNLDIHAVFTIFFKLQCITKKQKKKKKNKAKHRAKKKNQTEQNIEQTN